MHSRQLKSAALYAAIAGGLLCPLLGQSATPTGAVGEQKCDDVAQDRAACLRESGAAAQESRREGLTEPADKAQQQNATTRCGNQPANAKADCEARTGDGARTKTEGSVAGGGILRETVTPPSAPR